MGIELESETRIVVGRLQAPTDPDLPWWWESSTILDGAELTVAGFARTESDAILEAAASTLDLHAGIDRAPPRPASVPRATLERDIWAGNGDRPSEPIPDPEPSATG